MSAEVRYCTTADGVRIAYQIEGEGPPMLWGPQLFESFSVDHLVPRWEGMYRSLLRGRTIIRFDRRGLGLSQREVDDLSVEGFYRDVVAVVDAAGCDAVSLFGVGLNAPASMLYAARHPDRARQLDVSNGFVRAVDAMPEDVLRAMADLARTSWRQAARTFSPGASVEETDAWADAMVASTIGEHAARTILALIDIDATSMLADIKCPTLVVHYVDQPTVPIVCAENIVAGVTGARFVGIRATTREDRFERLLAAHDSFFLKERIAVAVVPPPVSLRTVLFTDIVGHTEMMQRLGDHKGRDLLREHERITRDLLKQHGGTEVKTTGDGFMASFGSVTKAIDCAIALQRAFAAHEGEPLQVRVGLNAGEPIEEDGDLFGSTVIMASRIAAKAGAGEILIPEPLRHLLSGKSYVYADRGNTLLKGFEDAVRLYEVRWRE
jgi:class 3 adenylate cyclase/pimeloyl-ACP methyl ester carboxylesterase